MLLPMVKSWFNSKRKQRFLMHLLLHHMAIIPPNSFTDHHFGRVQNLSTKFIFDVLSLFNHSCAPNAYFLHKNDMGCCITVRPIKKGEQIFINYLGDEATLPTEDRRREISKQWRFECKCDRCEPNIQALNLRQLLDDCLHQYIDEHWGDSLLPLGDDRRTLLQEKCAAFLTKYGRNWCLSIDAVIQLFMSTCSTW